MALKYYNFAHFLMIFIAAVQFFTIYFCLKKRSEKIKINVLLIVLLSNAILFVVYKIVMGITFDDFFVLNELPLHLCNLNVILLPVAIKTKNKFLCSYLFYVGTLAALAGVLFFDPLFEGRSVFGFATFLYFFYHSVLLTSSVLISALNIYTPKFLDIFRSLATLIVLCLTMHIVNTLFRTTKVCTVSNYFYTYGLKGNPVLGVLYKIIPVPVLYFFPIMPFLIGINLLMYLPFRKRIKKNLVID